ncbi:AMP-dependent synthetase/ligase [Penicillium chermesinum]|uniref:AMP-dependent synthetase/ligase n=1 Tax=Penicillium chermesinum TaxID=63820 RepID=A0A9W9TYN4_9EURO|nr:AMP-dependent synthetase/ligase [Penicillium chermesinum]KAJ5249262.1 AMP-dependent synthetase/ligase [Penicillium chermesinum]KAJ6151352.1 AMP-dependent synthetase/ligase [Penicillium chermesinum]
MASLIPPQLQELVTYVRSRSPYYQLLYANLPKEITNFESLPLVDNTLYWKSSNSEPNGVLTEPLKDAVVMRSGGSTSEPKTVYMTREEFLETSRINGELFGRCCGVRPGDRVANLSSQGGMYSGFMTYGYAVMNCSLPVVNLPISGKETPENIERDISQFKATVIISNVFIATKLAHYLRNKQTQLSSVRLILYTGEPFYKDLRLLYKSAFPNATIRPLAYASVECKIVAFPEYELNHEDEDGDINPVYRTCDRSVFLEIIAEDGSVIKVNGIRGNLVVTNLLKRLQPTVRYPIGDVGEWVNIQSGLFRLRGRSNVGLKIGTALLDKGLIRKLVIQVVGAGVADNFQIVIRRKDSCNIVLFRIAAQAPAGTDTIPQRLEEAIVNANPSWAINRDAGQIAPIEVEWVRFEQLVFLEASGKLREVIDERF